MKALLLLSVGLYFFAAVSGQRIGPIFRVQAVQSFLSSLPLKLCPINLILYVFRAIAPTFLAANYNHLRGATNVKTYSVLCRLSTINGKMFTY
jgi:hypothetical protein